MTVNDDDYTNDNDTIRSVLTRNSTEGRYHSIISWKVNSVEKMAWLICAGVDGIITDEVNKCVCRTKVGGGDFYQNLAYYD